MSMGWMALLGGLQGAGQGLEQFGMLQQAQQAKHQNMMDENNLMMQRERMLQSLKAPAEKVETMDDPDNPGHKIAVTKQWNPPTQDGQSGSYQEVARVHVPVAWKSDEKYINGPDGTPLVQKGFSDPDNPTKFIPTGDAIPKFDPEGKKRTALEAGRLGMEGQRLDFDKSKFAQEQAAKSDPSQRAALMPFEPVSEEDTDAQGNPVKTHKRFDRRTGVMSEPLKPSDLPQDPSQYVPGSPSAYAGADPSYAAQQVSPLSQFASAGQPKNQPAPMQSGGGGSGDSGPSAPAKGASTNDHGGAPRLQINKSTGAKRYVYPDGTIAPA